MWCSGWKTSRLAGNASLLYCLWWCDTSVAVSCVKGVLQWSHQLTRLITHCVTIKQYQQSSHSIVDVLRYVVNDSVARHCSGPVPPGSCSGLFPLQIDILTLLLLVGYFLMRPLCSHNVKSFFFLSPECLFAALFSTCHVDSVQSNNGVGPAESDQRDAAEQWNNAALQFLLSPARQRTFVKVELFSAAELFRVSVAQRAAPDCGAGSDSHLTETCRSLMCEQPERISQPTCEAGVCCGAAARKYL